MMDKPGCPFSLSKGTRADDDARIDTSPLQLTIPDSILVLADEVIDEGCPLLYLLQVLA